MQSEKHIPRHRMISNPDNFLGDSCLLAYEKYVMAQFKHPQDSQKIEEERQKAIDSLIPGTLNYYHLYFLDLVKKKKRIELFTSQENQLWEKFASKFGQTSEFHEVETWLNLINPLEELPLLTEDSPKENVDSYLKLVEYIRKYYLKQRPGHFQKPEYMNTDDKLSHSQDGELNAELQDSEKESAIFPFDKHFKSRPEQVNEIQKLLPKDSKNPQYWTVSQVYGFEDDLDWSLVPWEYVTRHTASLISASDYHQGLHLWQITNTSYLKKLAEGLSIQLDKEKERKAAIQKPMNAFNHHSDT